MDFMEQQAELSTRFDIAMAVAVLSKDNREDLIQAFEAASQCLQACVDDEEYEDAESNLEYLEQLVDEAESAV